jgi:tight adherence protein B
MGTALCGALDYLFYQNLFLMVLSAPFCLWYLHQKREMLRKERKHRIGEQFRDALVSLNVAVQAGYSLENALRECHRDMTKMYPPGADILEELSYMENQLYVAVPVEELFLDLGERTGVEDIESFAAVLMTAKRTGGDMSQIIQRTAMAISDKIDVQREIHATLAGKKYEQTIMSLMPAGIILYLRLTSPGYLDVLYGNPLGMGVMTASLALYGFAFWLGRRMIRIEV